MPEDLWKIRKRKGLSIKQLASKAGISADLVREYESGTQAIPSRDRRQLARVLYVGEWDINPRSSPPPQEQERAASPPRPPKARKKKEEKKAAPVPARESQVAHLLGLATHFGMDRAALEAEIGKPLDQLTKEDARWWNSHFTHRIAEERQSPTARRRSRLPEGVDGFEAVYLEELQAAGDQLTFTLFNGERHDGTLVGFGPYVITIRQADESELTINKLAVVYYCRTRGAR
jgi:transcriptional regulator with XRE-family HTH domain